MTRMKRLMRTVGMATLSPRASALERPRRWVAPASGRFTSACWWEIPGKLSRPPLLRSLHEVRSSERLRHRPGIQRARRAGVAQGGHPRRRPPAGIQPLRRDPLPADWTMRPNPGPPPERCRLRSHRFRRRDGARPLLPFRCRFGRPRALESNSESGGIRRSRAFLAAPSRKYPSAVELSKVATALTTHGVPAGGGPGTPEAAGA